MRERKHQCTDVSHVTPANTGQITERSGHRALRASGHILNPMQRLKTRLICMRRKKTYEESI